jgi:hypothetical protein
VSPLASWLVIAAATLAVLVLVLIIARLDVRLDEWLDHRRRVRRDLDDLHRLERARAALRRQHDTHTGKDRNA